MNDIIKLFGNIKIHDGIQEYNILCNNYDKALDYLDKINNNQSIKQSDLIVFLDNINKKHDEYMKSINFSYYENLEFLLYKIFHHYQNNKKNKIVLEYIKDLYIGIFDILDNIKKYESSDNSSDDELSDDEESYNDESYNDQLCNENKMDTTM